MHAILLALNAVSIAVAAVLVFNAASGDEGARTQSSVKAAMAGAHATGVKRFSPAR